MGGRLIWAALLLVCWGCAGGPGPQPDDGAVCELDAADFAPVLGGADGVVLVVDIDSGRELLALERGVTAADPLPAGSIFKLVTALAAMDAGKVRPDAFFNCYGEMQLGGRRIDCWLRAGHGPVDLPLALAHSCNLYFYRLGLRLAPDEVLPLARRLGLDRVRVSDSSELRQTGLGYTVGAGNIGWAAGADPGIRAAPRQVAALMRNLAAGSDIVDEAHLAVVHRGMALAVEEGTASGLANFHPAVAGKTGTGFELLTEPGVGWFAGFLPAGSPRVVLVTLVSPGRGQSHAVPAARAALEVLWRECPQLLSEP